MDWPALARYWSRSCRAPRQESLWSATASARCRAIRVAAVQRKLEDLRLRTQARRDRHQALAVFTPGEPFLPPGISGDAPRLSARRGDDVEVVAGQRYLPRISHPFAIRRKTRS